MDKPQRGAAGTINSRTWSSSSRAIDSMLLDVVHHRVRHLVADRGATYQPFTKVGGRDIEMQGADLSHMTACHGQHLVELVKVDRMAGARYDPEAAELEEAVNRMPARQITQNVGTGDKNPLCMGACFAHRRQRLDRKGRTTAADLQVADIKGRIVRDRQTDHGEPILGGGNMLPRFQRLLGRRHKEDPRDVELPADLLGHGQMAEMDRVEGTAQDCQSLSHTEIITEKRPQHTTGQRAGKRCGQGRFERVNSCRDGIYRLYSCSLADCQATTTGL